MSGAPLTVPTWEELSSMKPAQVRAVAAVLGILTPGGKPSGSAERVWDGISELLEAPIKAQRAARLAAHRAAHPELHAEYARIERQWEDGRAWFDYRVVVGPQGVGLLSGMRHDSPAALRAHLLVLGWEEARIIDDTARPAQAQVLAESRAAFRERVRLGARRVGLYGSLDRLTDHQIRLALSAAPEAR